MRSILKNAFRRQAAEARARGHYLKEEGKCEAFLKMPSDDRPPKRKRGGITAKEENEGNKRSAPRAHV